VNFQNTSSPQPGGITNIQSFVGGPGATNTLIAADGPNTWTITGANSGALNGGTFRDFQDVTGGAITDSFLIQAGGSVAGALDGGSGLNTLQGPDINNLWQITGVNSGALAKLVRFTSIQNLIGGTVNDSFVFSNSGSVSGSIDGGFGTNGLDYSAYTGDVTIDLPLHLASLVNQMAFNGVFNIQNVTGSIGNDLLVGDTNPNVLTGGTGRNIIIGGGGPDTITGGASDNILIGGTTIWDANLTALQAIIQEWTNTSLTFATRANALRKGITVGGKNYALNTSTVMKDKSPDSLVGGPGQNWSFFDLDDIINNGAGPGPNDRVTHV
jgi:hypothetical protein